MQRLVGANSNIKKYEVRTSLYGLNKANQYLTSEVLMDDDCRWMTLIVSANLSFVESHILIDFRLDSTRRTYDYFHILI